MSCLTFRLPLVTAAARGPSEEFRVHIALRRPLVLPGSAWGCALMYAKRRLLPVACAATTFAVLGLPAAADATVTQSYACTNNAGAQVATAPSDAVSVDVILDGRWSAACIKQGGRSDV